MDNNISLEKLDDSHVIYQYKDGFSFGTDAVLLSGFIKTHENSVGVEFGTGTGIIPVLLSMHKIFKHIFAVEIQKEYVELARKNIESNGFSDKVTVIEGDFCKIKDKISEKIDFIFANLPYMKETSGYRNLNEKKLFARHELNGGVDEALMSAGKLLQDKGEFFAVYRIDRMADMIFAMKNAKIEPKNIVFVCGAENKAPKLFLIRGVKGAKSGLITRKSFIVEEAPNKKTKECELLYKTGILEWENE